MWFVKCWRCPELNVRFRKRECAGRSAGRAFWAGSWERRRHGRGLKTEGMREGFRGRGASIPTWRSTAARSGWKGGGEAGGLRGEARDTWNPPGRRRRGRRRNASTEAENASDARKARAFKTGAWSSVHEMRTRGGNPLVRDERNYKFR